MLLGYLSERETKDCRKEANLDLDSKEQGSRSIEQKDYNPNVNYELMYRVIGLGD